MNPSTDLLKLAIKCRQISKDEKTSPDIAAVACALLKEYDDLATAVPTWANELQELEEKKKSLRARMRGLNVNG